MPCRRTQYRLQLFHKDFKSAFELGKVLQPISISIPGVREFTDRAVDIEEHIVELLNCSEQDNEPQHHVFPSFNHYIEIGKMNPAIGSAGSSDSGRRSKKSASLGLGLGTVLR